MDSGSLPELFSKAVPEDCVKYYLLLGENVLSKVENRMMLEEVRLAAERLANSLLENYLWQREGFCVEHAEVDGLDALRGETNFGDSIEDEMWIRLEDTDGEFLLIEAAKSLPRWLNPDMADNRVWINGGRLLILPPEHSDGRNYSGGLTLKQAFERLKASPAGLLHLPVLEDEAFRRLRKYPQDLAKNNHRALVLIPRNLAYILHHRPAHICPAADAFYVRDPISMRSLHSSRNSKLVFGPADLVEISVKFTRVGFAQLKTQYFPICNDWAKLLPDNGTAKVADRLELGMKVAYGFEILMTNPQNRDSPVVHEISKLLRKFQANAERLPSDQELDSWEKTEDDESWLNIDYADFERDLDSTPTSSFVESKGDDANPAREELQKLVSRFKTFVDQEESSDSYEGSSWESEDDSPIPEDNVVSEVEAAALGKSGDDFVFNEAKFVNMMQNLRSESKDLCREKPPNTEQAKGSDLANNTRAENQDGDEEAERLSRAMETELLELGALQSTRTKNSRRAFPARTTGLDNVENNLMQWNSHEEENTDYTLATNMLESFRSQAGLAGPGGNLMGLMGIRLPRDDGGSDRASEIASSITQNPGKGHEN